MRIAAYRNGCHVSCLPLEIRFFYNTLLNSFLRAKVSQNVFNFNQIESYVYSIFQYDTLFGKNYSSTREFELPTRGLDFVTLVFELVTHGFVLVTRGFKLVTRELELAIQGFKLVTRKF